MSASADPAPSGGETGEPLCTSTGGGDERAFHVALMWHTRADDSIDPPAEPWLTEQLAHLAELAGAGAGELTLVIVDDDQMADLHGRYHNDPTTTDVLSFDLRDQSDGPIEGDLVLCLDQARRQATARGHDVRLELLLYALHGLLHLLGYDDHEPAEAKRMHQREDELLSRAGFGPVYAREQVKRPDRRA